MATTRQITKTVVTRKPTDVEPKLVAVAVVAVLADVALIALYLAGAIDAPTLAAGIGPAALGVLAGYVKRSTHGAIDPEQLLELVQDAAPTVAELVPDAAPVAAAVADGAAFLREQLADSTAGPVAHATPAAPPA